MSRLKLFVPFAVFIALALLLWQGLKIDPTELPSSLVGQPVPEFAMGTVEDLNETKTQGDVKSDDFALINVWATWCGPCRMEHPYLLQLSKQGIPIYGVNANDELEAARAWLEKRGNPYQFTIYDPGGALAVDLGTTAYPESFLVDRDGTIRWSRRGIISPRVWKDEIQPLIDQMEKDKMQDKTGS